MSRIFWDTNLFVYLIEGSGPRAEKVLQLRQRMLDRNDQLFTSALTLGEVLVKPAEAGDRELSTRYENALRQGALVIDFDVEAARRFAEIRANAAVRPPDAIQLACASKAQIHLFITNDDRLSRKVIPGIEFIVSLDDAVL